MFVSYVRKNPKLYYPRGLLMPIYDQPITEALVIIICIVFFFKSVLFL